MPTKFEQLVRNVARFAIEVTKAGDALNDAIADMDVLPCDMGSKPPRKKPIPLGEDLGDLDEFDDEDDYDSEDDGYIRDDELEDEDDSDDEKTAEDIRRVFRLEKEPSHLERLAGNLDSILGRAISDATMQEINSMKKRLHELEQENSDLTERLRWAKADVDKEKAANEPLRAKARKAASIEAYGENLRATLRRYQSDTHRQRLEIEKLRRENESLGRSFNDVMEAKNRLAEDVRNLRETLDNLAGGGCCRAEEEDADEVNRRLTEASVEEDVVNTARGPRGE